MNEQVLDPTRMRFSIPEASRYLGVCERTVWRRIEAGHYGSVRDGRRVFMSRAQLVRAVEEGCVLA